MALGRIIRELTVAVLILMSSTFSARAQILSGVLNAVSGSNACAAPTFTYDWAAWNPNNYCASVGGGSCAGGGGTPLNYIQDSIANNVGSGPGALGAAYYLNQINGLGAATFSGTQAWTFTNAIPDSNNFTFWAVLKLSSNGGAIFGPTANGGLAWYVQPTQQALTADFTTVIGAASATYSTSTWYTVAATYNTSTGAYAFYTCSGGTCTNIGSGTNHVSLTQSTTRIGLGSGGSGTDLFTGQIAEAGYYNGISTTGIGAWSLCKYGI